MRTAPGPAPAVRHGVIRVLLVDSVVDDVRRVRAVLDREDEFRVHSARDVEEAEQQLIGGGFDAALIESSLWSPDGADLVRVVRDHHLDIAIVLLTSGNQREALPALKLGAHDFVSKQQLDDGEHLAARILAAVEESRALRRRDTMVRWLEREARTDHLTGLSNRRAFDERLAAACQDARSRGEPIALITVNVTGTRQVNEAYGHQAGDAMIRRASRAIARCVRGGDFAARIGGDDFGVMVQAGDSELARRMARRIAHEIERLNAEDRDGDIPVSVSFGIFSGTGCEPAELLSAAEQRLFTGSSSRPALLPVRPFIVPEGPSVA